MVRTQIQLDEDTFETVRRIAFRQQVTISEVSRRCVRQALRGARGRPGRKGFTFIGGARPAGRTSPRDTTRPWPRTCGDFRGHLGALRRCRPGRPAPQGGCDSHPRCRRTRRSAHDPFLRGLRDRGPAASAARGRRSQAFLWTTWTCSESCGWTRRCFARASSGMSSRAARGRASWTASVSPSSGGGRCGPSSPSTGTSRTRAS